VPRPQRPTEVAPARTSDIELRNRRSGINDTVSPPDRRVLITASESKRTTLLVVPQSAVRSGAKSPSTAENAIDTEL
jgi:hypothetical protein